MASAANPSSSVYFNLVSTIDEESPNIEEKTNNVVLYNKQQLDKTVISPESNIGQIGQNAPTNGEFGDEMRQSSYCRTVPSLLRNIANKTASLPIIKQRSGSFPTAIDEKAKGIQASFAMSAENLPANHSQGTHGPAALITRKLFSESSHPKQLEEFYKHQEELKANFRTDAEQVRQIVQQQNDAIEAGSTGNENNMSADDKRRRRDYYMAVATLIVNITVKQKKNIGNEKIRKPTIRALRLK